MINVKTELRWSRCRNFIFFTVVWILAPSTNSRKELYINVNYKYYCTSFTYYCSSFTNNKYILFIKFNSKSSDNGLVRNVHYVFLKFGIRPVRVPMLRDSPWAVRNVILAGEATRVSGERETRQWDASQITDWRSDFG